MVKVIIAALHDMKRNAFRINKSNPRVQYLSKNTTYILF